MEPLSILLKMVLETWGPGWPCGDVHARFNFSKEVDMFVKKERILEYQGHYFSLKSDKNVINSALNSALQ